MKSKLEILGTFFLSLIIGGSAFAANPNSMFKTGNKPVPVKITKKPRKHRRLQNKKAAEKPAAKKKVSTMTKNRHHNQKNFTEVKRAMAG